MALLKPKRELLMIWRAYLILAALIPAFLISLICSVYSALWTILVAVWGALFIFFYAFYLPLLFRRKSFNVERDKVSSQGGVFYRYHHSLPIENVQYVTIVTSPLDRLLRVCSLVVAAPGGKMILPGLDLTDGENLASILQQK